MPKPPEFQPPGDSTSSNIAPGISDEMLAAWKGASGDAITAIENLNETAAKIVPSIALTMQMIDMANNVMDRVGPLLNAAIGTQTIDQPQREAVHGLAKQLDGMFRRLQPFAPVLGRAGYIDGFAVSGLLNDLRNEVRP